MIHLCTVEYFRTQSRDDRSWKLWNAERQDFQNPGDADKLTDEQLFAVHTALTNCATNIRFVFIVSCGVNVPEKNVNNS